MTKEQLFKMYVEQKMSMQDIANALGCGETTVHRNMNKFGIQRRSRSEACQKMKSFSHRQKLADVRFKKKISSGNKNPNWRGGISLNKNERNVSGLTYWRNSVKRRDNFICQLCGVDGKKECESCSCKPQIHVHHVMPWSSYPELRLEISNGITVCSKCHFRLKGKHGELLENPNVKTRTISIQALGLRKA